MKYLATILLLIVSIFANATDYYVSNTGGGDTLQTLAEVNALTLSAGDNVYFKRGDAWEGQLYINQTGANGNNITYGSYGSGDAPKFYGSELITGWTLHSGNIYKATLTEDITQLFEDGNKLNVARMPKTGYYDITGVTTTKVFTSTDINGSIDYSDATVFIRSLSWKTYTGLITSSSSQTLTLEEAPSDIQAVGTGEGFILMNKLEFLTQAGEWYYDSATKTVYLWTTGGDSPANYEIRGSNTDYGIYVYHSQYVTIEDLHILHSSERGIYCNNSPFNEINNNTIDGTGVSAIRITDGSNYNNTITNNTIRNISGTAIYAYSSSSTFSNNTVRNVAMNENVGLTGTLTSCGIETFGDNITISHNVVEDIGYNGISYHGKTNIIENNYVNNACAYLDDGGGIYTWSNNYLTDGSANSIVRNNIITNIEGNAEGYTFGFPLAYGIYLDQRIRSNTIENNTIVSATGGILMNRDNGLNVVTGNTFFDVGLGLQIEPQWSGAPSTLTYNIVYATSNVRSFTWWTDKNQRMARRTNSTPSFDYNTYVSHYNSTTLFDSNSDGYFETFASWKSTTGQDANSTCDVSATTKQDTIITNPTDAAIMVYFDNSDNNENIDGTTLIDSTSISAWGSLIVLADAFNFTTSAPISNPEPDPDPDPDPDPEEPETPSGNIKYYHYKGKGLIIN
jgi:parallel beta-helix repeat protein